MRIAAGLAMVAIPTWIAVVSILGKPAPIATAASPKAEVTQTAALPGSAASLCPEESKHYSAASTPAEARAFAECVKRWSPPEEEDCIAADRAGTNLPGCVFVHHGDKVEVRTFAPQPLKPQRECQPTADIICERWPSGPAASNPPGRGRTK